ncbi:MAG TPA: hypothetical protein VFP50_04615 [Anaeromyxobacteraceae bacterium]|nr:hypothetical protein [Anaeromyxobacteraceae bacterium]
MSTAREKTFVCTLITRTRRFTARVRAWDEEQAALDFREDLEERGVPARGTILVWDASRPAPAPGSRLGYLAAEATTRR